MLAVAIIADNPGLELSGRFEHPYISIRPRGNFADIAAVDQYFQLRPITVVDVVLEARITHDDRLEAVLEEQPAYGNQVAEPRSSAFIRFRKTHVTAIDDYRLAFMLLGASCDGGIQFRNLPHWCG